MIQQDKLDQLKNQLQAFLDQLDSLNPETTSLEDVDQLIEIIEQMEKKLG
ncbi:SE1561 family protein [Amphibacillus sediminis]|nr:SE1561 family protein [Amphibacillus sediminis]